MAAIFQAKCETCGIESRLWPDLILTVRLPSGDEEPLPHPLEESYLRSLGLSWEQVNREGTLLHRAAVVCDRCSVVTPHDARDPRLREGWTWVDWGRVLFLSTGCMVGIILGWVSAGVWWGRVLVAFGFAIVGGFIGLELSDRLERIRSRFFPPSLARLGTEILCSTCGVGHLHRLASVAGLRLHCPRCGGESYVFSAVLIS
jgi:hypothetical protein